MSATSKKAAEAVSTVTTSGSQVVYSAQAWFDANPDRPVGPTVIFAMDKSTSKTTAANALLEAFVRALAKGRMVPVRLHEIEAEPRLKALYDGVFDTSFEGTVGNTHDGLWFPAFWSKAGGEGYLAADLGSNTWLRLREDVEKLKETDLDGSGMIFVLPVKSSLDAIDSLVKTVADIASLLPKAVIYIIRVVVDADFEGLPPSTRKLLETAESIAGADRCLTIGRCPEVPPGGFCRPFGDYATRAAEVFVGSSSEKMSMKALFAPGVTAERRKALLGRGDVAVRVQRWAEDVVQTMGRIVTDYEAICKDLGVDDYHPNAGAPALAAE